MPILLECGATIAEAGDPPGSLISLPRQIEFNGLLLGAGTPYRWVRLNGWDSLPGLDLGDSPRPSEDGDFTGRGLLQARLPSLEGFLLADTTAWTEQLVALLRQRMDYSDTPAGLYVADSGGTRWAPARVIARDLPHEPQRTIGRVQFGIQWKCGRPAQFATTTRRVTLVVAAPSGGVAYPTVYPIDYGDPGTSGDTVLTNAGDRAAPAVVTFTGPGRGHALRVGDAFVRIDQHLADGDQLVVDTGEGTVTLNEVDRSTWLSLDSTPPEEIRIPPGDSQATFSVTEDGGAGTSCRIEWADTF